MRIGEAIRTFRELLGLTQEEFGKRLWSQEGKPVDRKTVSNWENGKTSPTFDIIEQLSRIFSVAVQAKCGESSIESMQTQVSSAILSHGGGEHSFSEASPFAFASRYATLPMFSKELRLCAGRGNSFGEADLQMGDAVHVERWAIDGYNEESLCGMLVEGDSMEPDIPDGVTVIFDRGRGGEDIQHGEPVVVRWRGSWFVRYFHINPTEKMVTLFARNRNYRDIPVEFGDEELEFVHPIVVILPPAQKPVRYP